MKKFLFLLLTLALAGSAAAGETRVGKCLINSEDGNATVPQCLIMEEKDSEGYSSQTISRKDGKPLMENILMITVAYKDGEPGIVSGLTSSGVNSRWGGADKKGKCWIGCGFRICVSPKGVEGKKEK